MELTVSWPWVALLLLGALHGINPAMGWLFAVGLGLQRDSRRAVWWALGPLALGHLLAIAVTLAAAAAIGLVFPLGVLRWVVAGMLLAMGVLHLRRHLHFGRAGMRVGAKDLTWWSFLMASAHGAGLMALPFVLEAGSGEAAGLHHAHAHGTAGAGGAAGGALPLLAGLPSGELVGLLATLVHSAGYLAVTGVVAVVVYEKLGLRFLRSAWINVDYFWAIALILAAVLTPLV